MLSHLFKNALDSRFSIFPRDFLVNAAVIIITVRSNERRQGKPNDGRPSSNDSAGLTEEQPAGQRQAETSDRIAAEYSFQPRLCSSHRIVSTDSYPEALTVTKVMAAGNPGDI